MGTRSLLITAEVLVTILKGLHVGPPRYFRVLSDAVPQDATIVMVALQPDPTNHGTLVEILLESSAWKTNEPKTRIRPQLSLVEKE